MTPHQARSLAVILGTAADLAEELTTMEDEVTNVLADFQAAGFNVINIKAGRRPGA